MASTEKRLIYLVTDEGGVFDERWKFVVRAFSDEGMANECAEKRRERRKRSMEEFNDYWGTTVECVELIDVDAANDDRLQKEGGD